MKYFRLRMCCRYIQYEHFVLKVNSLLSEVGKDFDPKDWGLFLAYQMLLGLSFTCNHFLVVLIKKKNIIRVALCLLQNRFANAN